MTSELGIPEPSLINYLQVLRRRRWWVVGLVVLGVVAALGYAFTATKEYSANAQLLVQPSTGTVSLNGSQVSITPTDVLTELQLITSAPVKSAVTQKLGSAPNVSASEVGQTNVIQVTATSTSPANAAKVANAYANAFVTYERTATINSLTAAETQVQGQINSIDSEVASLQNQKSSSATNQVTALLNQEAVLKEQLAQLEVNGAVSTGGVQVVSPASVPQSPSSPKKAEDGIIGLVAGLVLGLGAAFLVDYLDDTVYSTDDVEQVTTEVPLLALVPVVSSWRDAKTPLVVTLEDPGSPVTESYRSLRTSLQFAGHERPLQTILVTSPSAAEGKTSTVSNLAVVLAGAGQRVIVVSADLRRPRIGQFFGMDEKVGLTSVILGESSLSDAVQQVQGVGRLSLLGTGPLPPNPAELLQSVRTGDILGALKKSFDVVLIDSPPVLPVTDAVVLAGRCDSTLIVVGAGRTKRRELTHAVDTLAQVNVPRLGIVLNAVTRQTGYGYGYGYRYGYRYQYASTSTYPHAISNGTETNGNGPVPRINRREPRHARRTRP